MSMITYAQNFEDVLLNRVFGGKRRGFYVDVGAAHPELLSVTKYFYDMGWRGINIEPHPELHALLAAQRPRDVNLCLGAGSRFEVREYYQSLVAEASSFIREAAQNQSENEELTPSMVEIRTLAEICRQFCDEPVDFLKIDVEGFERDVLEGADFERFRPVVVVVESIKPFGGCTWKTVRGDMAISLWEDVLTRNDYRRVYFDGLNSFFIRKEDPDIEAAFSIPVSFRDFILPTHSNLESSQLKLLPPAQAESYRRQTEFYQQLEKLRESEASKTREIKELRENHARELAELETRNTQDLAELEARKAKEFAALEARKLQEIDLRETMLAALRKTAAEQQNIVDDLRKSLASSRDEGKRLQSTVAADRQIIRDLDEKMRGLAMAMHARNACISWWRRIFLPKLPLPAIAEPIKLKPPATPKGMPGAAKTSAQKNAQPPLSPPPPPRTTTVRASSIVPEAPVSIASTAPDRRKPGAYECYPSKHSGGRLAEGGRRLKGEQRVSRPGEPLVSIVTTVRNGEEHLEKTIESVLEQTWPNIEYIIVDGASADGTVDLIKRYEEKIDYFLSEPDSGIYAGINKGIELAHGEYILILNADDRYLPEAVEKLVRIAETTGADLVAADSRNVDAEDRDVPPSPTSGLSRSSWTPMAYIVCPLKHEITLVHKNVYIRHGLYDEKLKICADWKWMAEVYDGGRCRIELLHEQLLVFRIHGSSSNPADAARHWQERLDVAAAFFPEVDEEDMPAIMSLHDPRRIRQLKWKYPASEKLHRILDIRRQGWLFATRVSDENFDPSPLPFTSMLPTPRTEPLCTGGPRSASHPGRWLRYPDHTGQRRAEGGRRLAKEYRLPLPDMPLVSIITTVRNGEKYLAQAMESVFLQTWPNIEYIVVDGASTDGTLDHIRRYEQRLDYYVSEPDTGIYAGMNKGIELAHGDFILLLNADDFFMSPDVVALLVEQTRDGVTDAVLGGAQRLDAKDQYAGQVRSIVDARLFLRTMVVPNAMLASKELYCRFGLYKESFKVVADWEWMRRVLPQARCRVVDEDILAYRLIGVSAQDTPEIAWEKYNIIASDVPGLTWEDFYPARYPHHLTRAESDALAAKYPDSAAFRAALALFPEVDSEK